MMNGPIRQFLMYGVIGCLSTALDFAVFAALTRGCGMHYQPANAISVFASLGNGFLLNYFFNFEVRGRFWTRMFLFYAVGMFGWAIGATQLWLYVECFGINELLAKLAAIVVCVIVQFLLNRFLTFGKGLGNGSRDSDLG